MPFRRSPKTYDEASLYEYALGALGRRMRSVAEIKRLMRQRVALQPDGEALVEAVVERLKEHRYLNDTEYAATYSSLRKQNDKFGRQRVISELKTRGVHQDVIDKAVASAYTGTDEEGLAREFLRRRRISKPSTKKEAARVFRALARGGFRSQTILSILKKWAVEEDVVSGLESLQGSGE